MCLARVGFGTSCRTARKTNRTSTRNEYRHVAASTDTATITNDTILLKQRQRRGEDSDAHGQDFGLWRSWSRCFGISRRHRDGCGYGYGSYA